MKASEIPEPWLAKPLRRVAAVGFLVATHTTTKHVDVTLRLALDDDVRIEKT